MTQRDSRWSAAVVDKRLRRAAMLSGEASVWPPLVDMSAEAVSARLRDCSEVSSLAVALSRAGAGLRAR